MTVKVLTVVRRLVVVFLQQAGQDFDRGLALGGMFQFALGFHQVGIGGGDGTTASVTQGDLLVLVWRSCSIGAALLSALPKTALPLLRSYNSCFDLQAQ